MTLWLLIGLAVVVGTVALAWRLHRRPGPILWQFGRFTNTRPGIRGHTIWGDEPEIVEYDDWRYWVRLRPNPGVNLPVVGYWSKANGRTRR